MFLIIILFFVFGVLIGSFCNVLVLRMRKKISFVKPASHCFSCKKKIAWKDNIPLISFLILKGKCRNCKAEISWQYPMVEFLTGVIWGLIGYLYVFNFIENLYIAVLWNLIFSALLVIFIYDWKYMEIPMGLVWFSFALIIIINFFTDKVDIIDLTSFFDSRMFVNGLSGLVAFLFFFGLSFISDEEWMGYGDSFLALLIGLALGPLPTFLALLIAFCVGSIFSIMIIVLGKASLKSQVPFGPFLIFGFILMFFIQFLFLSLLNLFV